MVRAPPWSTRTARPPERKPGRPCRAAFGRGRQQAGIRGAARLFWGLLRQRTRRRALARRSGVRRGSPTAGARRWLLAGCLWPQTGASGPTLRRVRWPTSSGADESAAGRRGGDTLVLNWRCSRKHVSSAAARRARPATLGMRPQHLALFSSALAWPAASGSQASSLARCDLGDPPYVHAICAEGFKFTEAAGIRATLWI